MTYNYVFATVLAALRLARNVTQSAIAEEYGASVSHISEFENGCLPNRNDVFLDVYSKVLSIPKVDISQLIEYWVTAVSTMHAKDIAKNEYVLFDWDYVKRLIRSEINNVYYQDALEPRTRRTFNRNYL